MSWALGLGIICGVLVGIYLVAEVIHEGNPMDETDYVAQQKRLTGKRARQQSGEFQEPRL